MAKKLLGLSRSRSRRQRQAFRMFEKMTLTDNEAVESAQTTSRDNANSAGNTSFLKGSLVRPDHDRASVLPKFEAEHQSATRHAVSEKSYNLRSGSNANSRLSGISVSNSNDRKRRHARVSDAEESDHETDQVKKTKHATAFSLENVFDFGTAVLQNNGSDLKQKRINESKIQSGSGLPPLDDKERKRLHFLGRKFRGVKGLTAEQWNLVEAFIDRGCRCEHDTGSVEGSAVRDDTDTGRDLDSLKDDDDETIMLDV